MSSVLPENPRVLLIGGDAREATRIASELLPERFRASTSPTLAAGLAHLTSEAVDIVLLHLDLPDSEGVDTLDRFRKVEPELPVVVVTRSNAPELGPFLVRAGAQDCVRSDTVDSRRLTHSIEFAIERQRLSRRADRARTRELLTREVQLQMKDQVLSRVSHELRTPISAMHEFLSLLADGLAGDLNTEQRSYVEIALKGANQLDRMVGDLLDTSRIALGRIEVAKRPVRVRDVVEDCVRLVGPAARAKNIELRVELGTESDVVDADPHRLAQVLTNLVENAVKFSPTGGNVRIAVARTTGGAEHGPGLQVTVEDDGPGIAPEERTTIFESLHQLADDGGESKGLGLGLHIAKELVALHGGRIGVSESELGGAAFCFVLPAAEPRGS
ncbi:MAG: hybrid sensor histidine kinase/response regulator [Gemmatimonadetes bacterium]|nr:hybrid sensor histidine kinase/response regulator [Gemmatimonadota bacterium]